MLLQWWHAWMSQKTSSGYENLIFFITFWRAIIYFPLIMSGFGKKNLIGLFIPCNYNKEKVKKVWQIPCTYFFTSLWADLIGSSSIVVSIFMAETSRFLWIYVRSFRWKINHVELIAVNSHNMMNKYRKIYPYLISNIPDIFLLE